MKSKLLLSAAPLALAFAATTMISSAAYAAQPSNIMEIRCSNNGNGNGEEILEEEVVEVGGTRTEMKCVKNVDMDTDKPGEPGEGPIDPN